MDSVLLRDVLLSILLLTNITILFVASYGIRLGIDALNNLSLHLGKMTGEFHFKQIPGYSEKDMAASKHLYDTALSAMKEYKASSNETKDISDIILSTHPEADNVLSMLKDLIKNYKIAMLTDFYDLVGAPTVFDDSKWGWDNLSTAEIVACEDMWKIEFPPLKLLSDLQAATSIEDVTPAPIGRIPLNNPYTKEVIVLTPVTKEDDDHN